LSIFINGHKVVDKDFDLFIKSIENPPQKRE
jgi:hypothetical protein